MSNVENLAIEYINKQTYPTIAINEDDITELIILMKELPYNVYGYYDSYAQITINADILGSETILITLIHELIHFIADKYFSPNYFDDDITFKSLLYFILPTEYDKYYNNDDDIIKANSFSELLEFLTYVEYIYE